MGGSERTVEPSGAAVAGNEAEEEPAAGNEPEEEATAEETFAEAERSEDAPLDFSGNLTPEDIEAITSFRVHLTLEVEGDALATSQEVGDMLGSTTIEAAVVKEPAAKHIIVSISETEEVEVVEFLMVDVDTLPRLKHGGFSAGG